MGKDDDEKRKRGKDKDKKRKEKDKKRRSSKDSRSGHSKSPRRGGATTDDENDLTDDNEAPSRGTSKSKSGKSSGRSGERGGKSAPSKGKSGKYSSRSAKQKSSRYRPKDDSEGEGGGGGDGGKLCCFGGLGRSRRGKRSKKKRKGGRNESLRREGEKSPRREVEKRPSVKKSSVKEEVGSHRSPSVSSASSRKSVPRELRKESHKEMPKEVETVAEARRMSTSRSSESLNSKKVLFNEVLAVREIPNKEVVKAAEHARTLPGYTSQDDGFPQHYYPGGDPFTAGSESSGDFNDLRGASQSEQSLGGEGDEPALPVDVLGDCADSLSRTGSLMSERNASPRISVPASGSASSFRSISVSRSRSQSREKDTASVKSLKSITLDEDAHLFKAERNYARAELMAMMERLVYGINNRECLKARYDEEATRLSMATQYQEEKIGHLRQKLEKLSADRQDLDMALKESAEHLTENLLQLNRERKRIAGAVDLREDFDRFLQQQICTKTKYFQDYAHTLGKLEVLLEDSTMQWVQRETMLSTEAEALERVRRSAEKEYAQLQVELRKQEAEYAARAAQNNKLSQLVEKELEKYARKQQNILRYNEKRIRALEGCVRTMQLDREVMYGEIAENRHRLKEVVEGRICALMDKVHSYKILLRNVREEIEAVLGTAKPGQAVSVSAMLSSYSRSIAALDLCALELQVKAAKQICDKAEQAFRKKNLQKKDLVEIRQTFVDSQKQTMLDSEDEYFLMEPVDVPGIQSNANFQRSLDDFTKECEFASGAATAPKVFAFAPEKDLKEPQVADTCGRPLSPHSEPGSCGPCNDIPHPLEDDHVVHSNYETHSEPKAECERVADGAATACSEKTPPGSKRRAVLNSLSMRSSRNIGNALKKFTHVGKR